MAMMLCWHCQTMLWHLALKLNTYQEQTHLKCQVLYKEEKKMISQL